MQFSRSTRSAPALLVAMLWAAGTPAVQAQSQAYDLPAQPLDTTLAQIARQGGLQLILPPALVRDRQAPAVRGRFEALTAMARALQGTGLEAVRDGSTVVVRRAAAPGSDGAAVLDTITVVGKGNAVTEGTGSYTTGAMNTATKLPLTMRDTPQSLSVVTRQKIDDQALLSIDDVGNSTTGITVNRWSDDRSRFFARGFVINNFLLDGVPISYETDTSTYSTMAMYDHVEVVRGPTGLMAGMGDPSGTINFVRKRPTSAPQFSVTARAGSWNHFATDLDASGPLNAAGSLRGRFVTTLQAKHNFLDGYRNRKQLYYGTLELDITRDTKLSVGGFHNNENNPGSQWFGVPTAPDGQFLNVPRSRRFSPSWSYWDKQEASAFAELEHRFDSGWAGKLTARTVHGRSALDGAYFVNGSYDSAGRMAYDVMGGRYDYDKKQLSLDASAQGPVQLFGRRHDLAVGASRRTIKWRDEGYSYLDAQGNYEMVTGVDPLGWNPDTLHRDQLVQEDLWRRQQSTTLNSAYATGRFNVADPLNFIVGARLDWFKFDNAQQQGSWSSERSYKETAHFTPYGAVVFDLDEQHAVYASHASIFKPQYYLDRAGQMLSPVEGKNFEIGLKASYLDERINAAIALFDTTQSNLPQAVGDIASCAVKTNCYRSVGRVKSRGVDLDIQGELLPRLNVGLGYTYTQAKIAGDSTDGSDGQPYASYIPQHQLKFSTMYHLAGGTAGWRVGGALRVQSRTTSFSYTNADGYVIAQSPFAVADLVLGYRFDKHLDLQLNIHNLFDRNYYETLQVRNGANYFGAPRNVLLTARYKF